MKTAHITRSLALSLALLTISSVAFAQDGVEVLSGEKSVEVNSKKSNLKFVSEAPAEKIEGVVDSGISGKFKMNMNNVAQTTGSISLPVDEMNTGNKLRDKHMQGKEWLDAKSNPNITFTIDNLSDVKVAKKDGDKQSFDAVANGKVNIHGVDSPAKAVVQVTTLASGKLKVEIKKFTVKLADHKIEGKKGTVGNKVGETIDISGIIYADAK